jgi:hypothetical protein
MRHRSWRLGPGAVIATASVLFAISTAAARPAVPPAFFGVVPQGPLSAQDFDRMHGAVGTLRISVFWFQCEPQPRQYDFSALDEVVGAAAEQGIDVLPVVWGSPAWLASNVARPPLATAQARHAWALFLRRLVERYGPGGTFWIGRERRPPIRRWQIWNEPNFLLFWRPRPSPRGYARLLAISAGAIRGADPGAQVVMGGVAPVNAGLSTSGFLRRLYEVPGVRRNFDLAAVHPYAATVAGVRSGIERIRAVMKAAGDRTKGLLVSELGVASTGSIPSDFVLGVGGQADFLRRAFGLLLHERRRWRVAGVDWFSWQDALPPIPTAPSAKAPACSMWRPTEASLGRVQADRVPRDPSLDVPSSSSMR